MDSIYKINHDLDVPIYQQLVDGIRTAIKNGTLSAGQQLLTVQEVTEKLPQPLSLIFFLTNRQRETKTGAL